MEKDFDRWNRLKRVLERRRDRRIFFYPREIWLCSIGLNLGHEQDGKGNKFLRPVLILKKFGEDVFWAVPLTSRIKKDIYHYELRAERSSSSAILSQLRLMDRKRLFAKIGVVSWSDFCAIRQKIFDLLR